LRYNAIPEEEEEGDGSIAVVAFFAMLRYSAAPKEEEEGDGSIVIVAFFNKIRGKRRRRQLCCHRLLVFVSSVVALPSSLRCATA
jgi:hypothetical protein